MGQTNVVILILESFSKEYIGFYNQHIDEYGGYTPFLDSLLTHCITYSHSFASGRKSIDAMPSVLSSIPMLIEPYIVTPYSTNAVSSIASCLQQEGYATAFFHGAPNGSMGFQAYARSAGFEQYFGMDEYDGIEAFDGTWAIWDEEFLQYYARTMSTMQQPFMTAVFTASSHHPFRVPKQYEGIFPKGQKPIHQCIGYTDHALRAFFDYAKTQEWYNNTLFVLTADHTNQTTLPEYATAKGMYEVPIAFYSPRWNGGELRSEGAVSQTDIMPSVLNYLGYQQPYVAFGEDALTRPKTHPWAVCYNHPVYQLLTDSLLLQFDAQQVSAVYNFHNDPLLTHDIADQCQTTELETYLKAYIQQYIYRLTTNQLTIPKNGNTSR
jgi:phosphoglycerol transferase MdoB-like AlkP superfamily enzyme